MPQVNEQLVEETEVRLLLDGLFHGFGFDFRDYVVPPLTRRIWQRIEEEGLETISQLQDKIFHQSGVLEDLLISLSGPRIPMFSNPVFYASFRSTVIPILKTYPSLHIWQPACSSGEEVYALAILLQEEGLLPRARLYATDLQKAIFGTAVQGLFPVDTMAMNADNYRQAGGRGTFADYYTIEGNQAVMASSLREHMTFSEHSLATDEGFNEFQLILCRHTMDMFNPWLQDRVQTLFYRSLCRFGMLGLDHPLSSKLVGDGIRYEEIGAGWYRKLVPRSFEPMAMADRREGRT